MPLIELRTTTGKSSPGDLKVSVQDKTYEYLLKSPAKDIRVSAFLEQDFAKVEAQYAEIFIQPECRFSSIITQVIPGSKTRTGIVLPGPMTKGEQLTLLVSRSVLQPL